MEVIGELINQSPGCLQGTILAQGTRGYVCPAAVAHGHWTFWIGRRTEGRSVRGLEVGRTCGRRVNVTAVTVPPRPQQCHRDCRCYRGHVNHWSHGSDGIYGSHCSHCSHCFTVGHCGQCSRCLGLGRVTVDVAPVTEVTAITGITEVTEVTAVTRRRPRARHDA